MAELILFPDPEDQLRLFFDAECDLVAEFAGVRAGTKIPNPKPPRYIRVLVVGGTEHDLVTDEPTLVVEAYAPDEVAAARLAEFCRAVLKRAARIGKIGTIPCRRVIEISRPQNLPDPLTSDIRYTATYAVQLRGIAA